MMTGAQLVRGNSPAAAQLAPGVEIRVFCNGDTGAKDLTVCSATMEADTEIPYHTHPTSEGISVLEGTASVFVEGRRYELSALDAIHVPAGVPHAVRNQSTATAVLHTSFPTGSPERDFLDDTFGVEDRSETDDAVPEKMVRAANAKRTDPPSGATCWDFFCAQTGARGISGGNVEIMSGGTLPCPALPTDGTLAVATASAVVTMNDQRYEMRALDSLFVPAQTEYHLQNPSDTTLNVIRVYASD